MKATSLKNLKIYNSAYTEDIGFEPRLRKILAKPDTYGEFSIPRNAKWDLLYQLSPRRESLLNWYNLRDKKVLELGAGCGPLSGLLSRNAPAVVALEPNEGHAKLAAKRHRNRSNLEFIAGTLSEMSPTEKFDVIVGVDALRRSHVLLGKKTADASNLLMSVFSLLKPGGVLLLGVNNALALRYWSGVADHATGRFFDSIEGYPESADEGFSKKEISRSLEANGLRAKRFYYPLPDMIFPQEVFSDDYLPGTEHMLNPFAIPGFANPLPRLNVFSERLAVNSVAKAGLFDEFANSFLIEAKRVES